ncbi:acetyl-CoA synthetase-like protein [Tilletiaria anomala UBC 951]|uniref:Acetyl-CoA synthetase-like protein n=1 Tax=Tilletiaria anomala (strain ATCC 24038 / CBS 436.72 / UBC 951) TaxID=1037660 RepID=A0A066V4N7_TILAU|nr:acetyl-CoA synthetase-like protein [Tilletiaria anomala UBC 951]KDN36697.1 acetyl-CoA synthetase-like protein [Tilletiaria anomala UBC 951]
MATTPLDMATYIPPDSSQPPADFVLRLTVSASIPHHRTPLSPLHFLLRAALIVPDKLALVHPEKGYRFTYSQWAARTLSLTFAINRLPGWKRGEKVAVIAPNTPLILEAHNGILAAGGIIVPINIRNTQAEVRYVLSHAGVRAILVDSEFEHLVPRDPHLDGGKAGVAVIVSHDTGGRAGSIADAYEGFLAEGRRYWEEVQRKELEAVRNLVLPEYAARRDWELIEVTSNEDEACALCYTSGTTGRPKGVLTTHRGSYLAALSNAYESKIDRFSVYLWVLPAFHACGWTYVWAINAAFATHYILRKVDYDVIWHALTHSGVTHYCGAPTVQLAIVHHPDAKKVNVDGRGVVRVAVAASAPTASLLGKMEALGLEPIHVYGLTESYGPLVQRYPDPEWKSLNVDERARLMARQGHGFLAADEARVFKRPEDFDGDWSKVHGPLRPVKRDGKELGEIALRGNLVMLGYFQDAAATSRVMKDNWFMTGDLAVRHPGGEVAILDRGKDLVISGGENVSSLMVEQELAAHPDVLECALIARPHPKWSESGHAFVVLNSCALQREGGYANVKSGAAATARMHESFRAHCKARMSGFAVPQWFEIVDELPKTSTGKVQKNVLRERVKGYDDKQSKL